MIVDAEMTILKRSFAYELSIYPNAGSDRINMKKKQMTIDPQRNEE